MPDDLVCVPLPISFVPITAGVAVMVGIWQAKNASNIAAPFAPLRQCELSLCDFTSLFVGGWSDLLLNNLKDIY